MEKLGQLRAREEWDLIVVDTPPSRSALDFLDAPKRLGSFLDGKFIKLLMAPAKMGGRAGMKFLNVGMSMMTGTLGKLLGGQFLRDVQTFVAAMDTMFGGFRTRADATFKLLQAPGTAFLVVATPERDALREAAYFVERLASEDMPLAGLVLNRVHGSEAARLSAERALAAAENLEAAGIVDQRAGKAGLREPADSPKAGTAQTTDTAGAATPDPSEHASEHESADTPEAGAPADTTACADSAHQSALHRRRGRRRAAHRARRAATRRLRRAADCRSAASARRKDAGGRARTAHTRPVHRAASRGGRDRGGRAARRCSRPRRAANHRGPARYRFCPGRSCVAAPKPELRSHPVIRSTRQDARK